MLGRLYTLFMAPTGSDRSLQHVMMWTSVRSLQGSVYAEFSDSVPVGPLRNRVSLLRLVTVGCRGIRHILVHRHRHPLRTAVLEDIFLHLHPSLCLRNVPLSQMQKYRYLTNREDHQMFQ